MSDWLEALLTWPRAVLVTVAAVQGSGPREVGAKLTVGPETVAGTIGGGNLEYQAILTARELLAQGEGRSRLQRYVLGASLGQCCGGAVTLLFEPVTAAPDWARQLHARRAAGAATWMVSRVGVDKQLAAGGEPGLRETADGVVFVECVTPVDFTIVLFGAGHVGRALVTVLGGLPCRLIWVDSRAGEFPESVPATVTVEVTDTPEYAVDRAPPGAYFLVMTHSHALDQTICERVLRRGDFAYLGLIGSLTKRRTFEKRLLRQGISAQALERLTCPVGIAGITGKHPAEIAIAAAAQVLRVRSAVDSPSLSPA